MIAYDTIKLFFGWFCVLLILGCVIRNSCTRSGVKPRVAQESSYCTSLLRIWSKSLAGKMLSLAANLFRSILHNLISLLMSDHCSRKNELKTFRKVYYLEYFLNKLCTQVYSSLKDLTWLFLRPKHYGTFKKWPYVHKRRLHKIAKNWSSPPLSKKCSH